jgi:hypothetical protein
MTTAAAAIAMAATFGAAVRGQKAEPQPGVLDEHPAIQYRFRPTTDRVTTLSHAVASGLTIPRDPQTGYLRGVLDALGVPVSSQLLVFSKTGVQRAYTNPHTPRALYFDQSVFVGYVPNAPLIEIAAHDPQQGVVFYTVDQSAAKASFKREMSCLTCHVSASTLDVPGIIARSNTVSEDGNIQPQEGSHDVNQTTPHPERWGGWFVTSEDAAPPYQQMAHRGNITFSGRSTSNQVFVDWLTSSPETRGYPLPSSDIVGLLLFDHQARAINLLTRLNWESRVGSAQVGALEREFAGYLLFEGEAGPLSPLTPKPEFAASLAAHVPKDHLGRSFGQLDMDQRMLRYPCSYMIYSDAFEALPASVKQAIYRQMIETLSKDIPHTLKTARVVADRRAVLEILRDTKPDFPSE